MRIMRKKGNTFEFSRCPHCITKTARGEEQVLERFGTRNNQGYLMVQSWCRECRSSS